MRMVRGFYNEQNNTVNVIHYDTNCILSLDCGKWEQGLRTTPGSQGKMDAPAIDDPVEYVRLMLSGEMQVWLDALDDCSIWCVTKWRHFSKRETKVTHLLIVDFRLVQHKKYFPEGAPTYSCEYRLLAVEFAKCR